MSRELLIYGAGGFAREVAWMVDSNPHDALRVAAFVDDFIEDNDRFADPRPIYSFERAMAEHPNAGLCVAVGHPKTRASIMGKLAAQDFKPVNVLHHSLTLSDRVHVGQHSIICQGTVFTVDIGLGMGVHVNLNCTIGHDVQIGDCSTLSPGVHVSGNVAIGEKVFIGTGASILNGAEGEPLLIGDGAVVAAGACVTKPVAPNTMVAGIPAVLKKVLSE